MDEFSFLLATAKSFSFFKRYASMVSFPTICSSSHIFSFSLRSSVSVADVPWNFPSMYWLFHLVISPGYISFSLESSSMLRPFSTLSTISILKSLVYFLLCLLISFPLSNSLVILTCLKNVFNFRGSLQNVDLI